MIGDVGQSLTDLSISAVNRTRSQLLDHYKERSPNFRSCSRLFCTSSGRFLLRRHLRAGARRSAGVRAGTRRTTDGGATAKCVFVQQRVLAQWYHTGFRTPETRVRSLAGAESLLKHSNCSFRGQPGRLFLALPAAANARPAAARIRRASGFPRVALALWRCEAAPDAHLVMVMYLGHGHPKVS